MGDSEINVPVEVRSHELGQLRDWTPTVAANLYDVSTDENGLLEEADTIQRIYDEYINTVEGEYISMPADDWRALVANLDRIEDEEGINRVYWLRKKLVTRLRDKLDEMEDE